MAALLGASLLLIGCGDPSDGADGVGKTSDVVGGANVSATDLSDAFAAADIVTLASVSVDTVEGTVPAGKKLIVLGEVAVGDASIDGSERLVVEAGGVVEVRAGAALTANGESTTSGLIVGAAGSVDGDGVVLLPFVTDSTADNPGGYLVYNSSTAKGRAAGSVTADVTAFSAVDVDAVLAIFELTGADATNTLAVAGLEDIVDATIPLNKTLTVVGAGNTIDDGVTSFSPAGSLTVAKDAELTLNASTAVAANKITNNGTIKSDTTVAATQKSLVTLGGFGTVELSGEGAGVISDTTLTLGQNIKISGASSKVIAPAVATPFDGGKTITVASDGTLDFGAAAVSSIGATVVNGGTVTTVTTSVAALNTIAGLGGAIESDGNVAGNDSLLIPVGTALTHDTGTFVGGSGTVTVKGTATFTTGTFESQTGAVTVDGTATFTLGTFVGLVGSAGSPIFTVGSNGTATLSAATFAATTVGDIVIDGTATLDGIAIPGGNVTVGRLLTISSGASLTIAGGKNLLVKNGASLGLDGSDGVVLKGATPAGAKLTLGNGATGKNTVIKVANAVSETNAVTDATITAATTAVTIAVIAAGSDGTDEKGAATAANGSTADAIITIGTNKTTGEGTGDFTHGYAVVADANAVVPQATNAGLGLGVTIDTGVITVGAKGATDAE
jgi:hypothetical protein